MQVWNVLDAARWKYRTQKIAILAPSHSFVRLYLWNEGMHRQSKKNLLNSNASSTCPDNMVNFSLVTAEICWRVWGSPANFNGFRVLAARHSSSGRQPDFPALNRGRHLYSAGRPSRWALAHILVVFLFPSTAIIISAWIYAKNDNDCRILQVPRHCQTVLRHSSG